MRSLFLQNLATPDGRFYYFAWVLIAVVSTVLHELGHGLTAIKLGDNTPREQGRITGNPLVHLGPFSIGALLITGMCWGAMPVDPTRLRGRYGETQMALAGPLANLLIALLALVANSMWIRFSGGIPEQATTASRASQLLWMTCYINLILFAFNLLPLPPLDGSHILANLSPRYRELLSTEGFRSMSIVLFIAAFVLIGFLFEPMQQVALVLTEMLSGVDLFLTGD